ncbi:MAG: hypothetical protein U1E22_06735, partial [Coriobacteriia bacterium]|nr:hypothetical protein [Coriobacteriia bacterium]
PKAVRSCRGAPSCDRRFTATRGVQVLYAEESRLGRMASRDLALSPHCASLPTTPQGGGHHRSYTGGIHRSHVMR